MTQNECTDTDFVVVICYIFSRFLVFFLYFYLYFIMSIFFFCCSFFNFLCNIACVFNLKNTKTRN